MTFPLPWRRTYFSSWHVKRICQMFSLFPIVIGGSLAIIRRPSPEQLIDPFRHYARGLRGDIAFVISLLFPSFLRGDLPDRLWSSSRLTWCMTETCLS